MVEFCVGQMEVTPLKVPIFKALHSIRGDREEIERQLAELNSKAQKAWLEIIYEGKEIISDLREQMEAATAGTELELLRVSDNHSWQQVMNLMEEGEVLSELDHSEVFQRCLEAYEVEAEQRQVLLQMYNEILDSLLMEDVMAE